MMVIASALLCLSLNVYHEARSESIPGQYAVALVTMNRAKESQSSICRTVFKSKQFSWTNGQFVQVKNGYRVSLKMTPKDQHAWKLAKRVAQVTLSGRMLDFTKGANHYHTVAVAPKWAMKMDRTRKIGKHIFYAA
jgi:spore germination cell wall hydrolase CwlJ-like protein